MKVKGQSEKWVRRVLGVVCLLLVIDIVFQFGGVRAAAARLLVRAGGGAAKRLPTASSPSSADELARYDPKVRLDLLKKLQSRPLPRIARDPFGMEAQRAAAQPPAPAPAPIAPPPPPPIPLKGLGYSEKDGRQEAFVADEDQTYVVHEGEAFAQRYRVLKITPKFIEIQDDSTHQTVQLPFAQ